MRLKEPTSALPTSPDIEEVRSALQTHAAALTATPQDWIPWNYRDALTRGAASPTSAD